MSAGEQQQQGFVHTITKRALAPVLEGAAAAATAFLIRKATTLWQERVQPTLAERGGATAVAREALDSVGDKLPTPPAASTEDADRDEERRKREKRRAQRRRSLEQARSS
ncbi:MAG: hypothetical protein ACJ75Q_13770 [Gaiellaceae bacterium]